MGIYVVVTNGKPSSVPTFTPNDPNGHSESEQTTHLRKTGLSLLVTFDRGVAVWFPASLQVFFPSPGVTRVTLL
jgi:hypothetical protein